MGGVARRYIDILIMIITFPTPLVLALFWQQHPYSGVLRTGSRTESKKFTDISMECCGVMDGLITF